MKSSRIILIALLSIGLISCNQEASSTNNDQSSTTPLDKSDQTKAQAKKSVTAQSDGHNHDSPFHKKDAVAQKNPGDREGHDMSEVVPRDVIPPAPILSIEEALASFHVHDDFELQVIAKEPLLFDPIVAIYDAAGRIWAVEMTTFMQDTKATGQFLKESQIVVLTDTDGDGEMDKRQVVLEKLLLPRALAFVPGGILWADNEQLYFTELTQGSTDKNSENKNKFTVVKTDVVDPTYAQNGNIEHKTNGLLFSLDNWYYNAKSAVRYRPYPLSAAVPEHSKEVYRNHLWKMVKSSTEFRGQFGLSQDDYGRHYFNGNSTPILTTSFIPNVSNRNPKEKLPKNLVNQKVGTTDIYPVRVTSGINRGYQKGYYNKDFKLKNHTAACSPLIYRGDQFPAHYYGIGLAQEPAANLVKATRITDVDGVVTGENLFKQQEILASTDERFRPVNAVNAPDGTVTLVDFYHGIIQERTFLTSYLSNQIKMRDLERNTHIGRLYRLKYKNKPLASVTYLEELTPKALVPFLAHTNGWHRDMAQQLLVMKQDTTVVEDLKVMAISHPNHLARIKALWTLEGLAAIDFATLQAASNTASQNGNNKVLVSIYRLADLIQPSADVTQWLISEATKANQETHASLALAAGTHKAWPATTLLINKFELNAFIIASLGYQEGNYLAAEGKNINAKANQALTALSQKVIEKKAVKTYSKAVTEQIALGKKLYNGKASCFGCHGADGEGSQFIPPLNKSKWVTESDKRLMAILLHGLSGPIKVRDTLYEVPMTMPGLGANTDFTDEDLAAIATYIRTGWNNSAAPVSVETVKAIREATADQKDTYTVDTLSAFK